MPKTKKELTLREKNVKEIISCKKKVEKFKQTLLQDLNESEELTLFFEQTMDDLITAFNGLSSIVENSIYKDDENELD